MKIVTLLFERMTALDAIGPYEVLARLPGVDFLFVSPDGSPVAIDTGQLILNPGAGTANVDAADVLLIPGGPGDREMREDAALLDWIARMDTKTAWTTSVCTGSLILAAAGVLKGKKATTHWSCLDELAALGAEPVSERVVVDGKYVTAAGVSAGIDMALSLTERLCGRQVAEAFQLGIEYDPAPPFDAGHPRKADPEIVEIVRNALKRSRE